MTKIYACLCGEWCCLDDDPSCIMGPEKQKPYLWYEEGASINCKSSNKNNFYNMDYVCIHYKEKDYRINPIFIQVVTD